MLDAVVTVTAPSRLHFGLLSFGQATGRQYGGVGVMIDAPGIELRAHPSKRFAVEGPLAERAEAFARRFFASHDIDVLPGLTVEVRSAPPEHVGLGVGTQLGLAVAKALERLCKFPAASAAELAQRVGRGKRSAVGTYGFASGGMIVDRGRAPHEELAAPGRRVELCRDWRFVLIRAPRTAGLYGEVEQQAFHTAPPVPPEVTARLEQELFERLVPSAAAGRFDEFSESVYQYGRLAGECFASVQGGPYNGLALERLVNLVRSWGVLGVGQSSWGPTLFAIVRNRTEAGDLVQRLAPLAGEGVETTIAAVSAGGAEVRVE